MKKILVATDGSEAGDRAVLLAAQLAAALSGKFMIFTVGQTSITEGMRELGRSERASLNEIIDADCRAILSSATIVAAPAGIEAESAMDVGDPATLILLQANSWKADAIVVGKRGRGRLEGLLLGSISQKLVSLAQCPVIVVP